MKTSIYLFKSFVVLFSISVFLLLISCKKSFSKGTGSSRDTTLVAAAGTTSATNYQLVWADEFDGNSVNTGNWNFETGGGGWGNHEQEYYQAANASVTNGNLVITAKKQRVKSNAYTSARMTTKGKHEFTYGKIEARIKIPLGQGLWPAFWMLGANIGTDGWPKCGETDIMEHINTNDTMYGTVHWDNR